MVGRSIASISSLGGKSFLVLCASVNMVPRVGYIGYGPPYHTICNTYSTVGRSIADIYNRGAYILIDLFKYERRGRI